MSSKEWILDHNAKNSIRWKFSNGVNVGYVRNWFMDSWHWWVELGDCYSIPGLTVGTESTLEEAKIKVEEVFEYID